MRLASEGLSAASGWIVVNSSIETTTLIWLKKCFLIDIFFSYLAADFPRPYCDWLPVDPETCFSASTLLLRSTSDSHVLAKIDASGTDRSGTGAATLAGRYLSSGHC